MDSMVMTIVVSSGSRSRPRRRFAVVAAAQLAAVPSRAAVVAEAAVAVDMLTMTVRTVMPWLIGKNPEAQTASVSAAVTVSAAGASEAVAVAAEARAEARAVAVAVALGDRSGNTRVHTPRKL